jgi:tetratricopeptide (TPR) repeat protein
MASDSSKNLIIIALFIIALGLGIFILTRSADKTERSATGGIERTPVQGPIVDSGSLEPLPLDQLGVNTNDPIALASLGDRYFESSNFQQAITIYEKVLELNPNDVDTYNDLGLALHYTGQPDAAVETLRKGIEVVPTYQRIWLSLGFVLAAINRNEEANPALQKAIDLDPETIMGQEAKRIQGLLK